MRIRGRVAGFLLKSHFLGAPRPRILTQLRFYTRQAHRYGGKDRQLSEKFQQRKYANWESFLPQMGATSLALGIVIAVLGTPSEPTQNEAPTKREEITVRNSEPQDEIPITTGSSKAFKRLYKLYKILGEGTFAVVRLAVDKQTKERVAVKEIDRDLSDEEALQNEIDIMRASGIHRNLISLRAVYHTPHTCYLVIDLAEGGELFDHIIEQGELTERQASKTFHDAIQGLHHLHNNKICHLDIKPENLLLTSKNDASYIKLADFGLAVKLEDNERCETCVGTPAYWAPEMVKRELFGKPVDIWALGCVLYIMLVGVHPFDPTGDSSEAQILAHVAEGVYDTTSEQYQQLSATAKDLIRHMLDPDPEKRYTSAKVLEHPWLSHAEELSDKPLPSSHITKLRGFRVLRMLKAGMQHVMGRASSDLFDVFDEDADGLLSREELTAALATVGHKHDGKSIDEALKILDIDGDGYVSKQEFEEVLNSTLESPGIRASIHDIEDLFNIFDRNKDGYVYKEDFKHVLGLLGAPPTESVVSVEIERADHDNDGKVDFADFVKYIRLVEDSRVKLGYASVNSMFTKQGIGLNTSRASNLQMRATKHVSKTTITSATPGTS